MSADDKDALKPSPPKAGVCPNCGKPRSERYSPFCSKRCADVDLHRWLKGGYVIPGTEPVKGESEDD
jgi:uncharacterized protein